MFATPGVEEVVALARGFGVELDEATATAYRDLLVTELERFDEFAMARLPEAVPPLRQPARERGHRPTAAEDPLNAWLWRCRIGGEEGLLAGRTVSFKDHVAVAGIPMSGGIYALEGFVPDFDATVVTRVLEAGGTIIGKNTMNASGGGKGGPPGTGDYWRPRNPHAPEHYSGGSSSGSAVAVAAGEVDVAFGGDQGGSIRIPAAYCGVVGLKPTFGLISHMGIAFGSEPSIDHVGPLARHVEECARALEAVAGADGYDPRQSREIPERYDALDGLDHGVAGLRIGLLEEAFDEPISPAVRAGVEAACQALVAGGASLERVSVPEHREIATAYDALMVEGALGCYDTGPFGFGARTFHPVGLTVAMNRLWREDLGRLQPRLLRKYLLAALSRSNFHGAIYAKGQNVRPHYIAAYDRALASVDVLAMPTCRQVAERAEPPSDGAPIRGHVGTDAGGHAYNTSPFDYTGHPALALPCAKDGALPVSLQLVGRRLDDALLLRAGQALEQALDWKGLLATGG